MFIRVKFGRYAGEIRDVQAEAAQGLLASGRAEDPYAPAPEIRATQPEVSEKPKRKSRTHIPAELR